MALSIVSRPQVHRCRKSSLQLVLIRPWAKKLYKVMTAARKKALALSSEGMVIKKINKAGKVTVSGPERHRLLAARVQGLS